MMETQMQMAKRQTPLSKEDIASLGMENNRIEAQMEQLEAEKKAAVDAFKEQIGQLAAKRIKNRDTMNQGFIEEELAVDVLMNTPTAGMKTLVDARDPSIVVAQEPMTMADRQMHLRMQ